MENWMVVWWAMGIFAAVLMVAKNKFFPSAKKLHWVWLSLIRTAEIIVGGGFYLFLVSIEWYLGPPWKT